MRSIYSQISFSLARVCLLNTSMRSRFWNHAIYWSSWAPRFRFVSVCFRNVKLLIRRSTHLLLWSIPCLKTFHVLYVCVGVVVIYLFPSFVWIVLTLQLFNKDAVAAFTRGVKMSVPEGATEPVLTDKGAKGTYRDVACLGMAWVGLIRNSSC
jgi:hypothetical protein